jgi:NAD(P)-dependent dehydrogenase (short-subunit alcohol dehydrogenase family)
MTPSWVEEAIPEAVTRQADADASRTRIGDALDVPVDPFDERSVGFAQQAWELALFDALGDGDSTREPAEHAFQLLRIMSPPREAPEASRFLVRLGCLGLLADRQADAGRVLSGHAVPRDEEEEWGRRAETTVWNAWLRLIRKAGWEDFDAVVASIEELRGAQEDFERGYLAGDDGTARVRAWELVALYHAARAAELLAEFCTTGGAEGRFDIREQLDSQFDRALTACRRGELVELELLLRLIQAAAARLVDNSIWTVTRAVNSRVSDFVRSVVQRGREHPLFEVLPPQRHALRERGLLGSATRSVVVSLPTSSGKTLIAQFRMLQALNQFDREGGWVAYLAPTRTLVNQITRRLREDFAPLGVSVERVSPALEVDSLESSLLTDREEDSQFRVLVTTPEKLDLLIRGGWEETIGRPLTLVVVDEAHNLRQDSRGLRLELLLATVNRECRFAQFMLLTPFMEDAEVLGRWLAPDSHQEVRLEVEWVPNDRAIMLSFANKGERRGTFSVELESLHTTRPTLSSEERFDLETDRPLGLSWSEVNGAPSRIAAATAELLKDRGPSIILAGRPDHAWTIARTLFEGQPEPESVPADVALVRDFLAEELGEDFPLVSYLERGIGVHHAGIAEEARILQEWLLEREQVRHLVATTTIAQGVNFPVATVILASHQYPYGQDMPPEDFWNVAGRTGRIGQTDLGIVVLAAKDQARAEVLRSFVNRQVAGFDSTLVKMALAAQQAIAEEDLARLSWTPGWSSFLQYLAHSYRQIGDPTLFASEVEQVLRGALGYQQLRSERPELAEDLLGAVGVYAEGLSGKPLSLVDATGFSWESVNATLARLGEAGVGAEAWDGGTLFNPGNADLRKLMGLILQVPELRENLDFALGGVQVNGTLLAEVTSDWVHGRKLTEIAAEYFTKAKGTPESAMTDCCKVIYGRLAPTVSWGLSALQSLTLGDEIENMTEVEAAEVRNLPSRVFYGVNSDPAIALRLLGVPRQAATPLSARVEGLRRGDPLGKVRQDLSGFGEEDWRAAIGPEGPLYRSIWRVLEGTHDG